MANGNEAHAAPNSRLSGRQGTFGQQNGKAKGEDLPRVVMITPTFRLEDDPTTDAYKARYQGVIALYEQFIAQDYPADKLELRIADSSAKPHPFFVALNDPRVKYVHLPERSEAAKAKLEAAHPGAGQFMLTDAELSTPEQRTRIQALHSHCSRKKGPDGTEVPSIQDPLEIPRPTIGMKRNILCGMAFGAKDSGLKPEIIVAADDDDWRGPNYVSETVERLQDADWTKLVSYHLAIYNTFSDEMVWAKKHFDALDEPDERGLVSLKMPNLGLTFNAEAAAKQTEPDQNAGIEETSAEKAFQSPRWHSLSTDGAVHALRYDAWERTVELFGGYMPVSYNEDTLMFEAIKLLGNVDDPQTAQVRPVLYDALTGGQTFDAATIAADAAKGTASFKPEFEDTNIFVRLCCANVSPVAFTSLEQDELPKEFDGAFDYMYKDERKRSSAQAPKRSRQM